MVQGLSYLWVRYRMRPLTDKWNQIVHWKLYHPLGDWQPTTKQNYRINLWIYYLNNSQFSCFLKLIYISLSLLVLTLSFSYVLHALIRIGEWKWVNAIRPIIKTSSSNISLIDESFLVWFSKQRRECFKGARCLYCEPVREFSFESWGVGRGSWLRRANWDIVLRAMLWSPSSDGCGKDCSPLLKHDC